MNVFLQDNGSQGLLQDSDLLQAVLGLSFGETDLPDGETVATDGANPNGSSQRPAYTNTPLHYSSVTQPPSSAASIKPTKPGPNLLGISIHPPSSPIGNNPERSMARPPVLGPGGTRCLLPQEAEALERQARKELEEEKARKQRMKNLQLSRQAYRSSSRTLNQDRQVGKWTDPSDESDYDSQDDYGEEGDSSVGAGSLSGFQTPLSLTSPGNVPHSLPSPASQPGKGDAPAAITLRHVQKGPHLLSPSAMTGHSQSPTMTGLSTPSKRALYNCTLLKIHPSLADAVLETNAFEVLRASLFRATGDRRGAKGVQQREKPNALHISRSNSHICAGSSKPLLSSASSIPPSSPTAMAEPPVAGTLMRASGHAKAPDVHKTAREAGVIVIPGTAPLAYPRSMNPAHILQGHETTRSSTRSLGVALARKRVMQRLVRPLSVKHDVELGWFQRRYGSELIPSDLVAEAVSAKKNVPEALVKAPTPAPGMLSSNLRPAMRNDEVRDSQQQQLPPQQVEEEEKKLPNDELEPLRRWTSRPGFAERKAVYLPYHPHPGQGLHVLPDGTVPAYAPYPALPSSGKHAGRQHSPGDPPLTTSPILFSPRIAALAQAPTPQPPQGITTRLRKAVRQREWHPALPGSYAHGQRGHSPSSPSEGWAPPSQLTPAQQLSREYTRAQAARAESKKLQLKLAQRRPAPWSKNKADPSSLHLHSPSNTSPGVSPHFQGGTLPPPSTASHITSPLPSPTSRPTRPPSQGPPPGGYAAAYSAASLAAQQNQRGAHRNSNTTSDHTQTHAQTTPASATSGAPLASAPHGASPASGKPADKHVTPDDSETYEQQQHSRRSSMQATAHTRSRREGLRPSSSTGSLALRSPSEPAHAPTAGIRSASTSTVSLAGTTDAEAGGKRALPPKNKGAKLPPPSSFKPTMAGISPPAPLTASSSARANAGPKPVTGLGTGTASAPAPTTTSTGVGNDHPNDSSISRSASRSSFLPELHTAEGQALQEKLQALQAKMIRRQSSSGAIDVSGLPASPINADSKITHSPSALTTDLSRSSPAGVPISLPISSSPSDPALTQNTTGRSTPNLHRGMPSRQEPKSPTTPEEPVPRRRGGVVHGAPPVSRSARANMTERRSFSLSRSFSGHGPGPSPNPGPGPYMQAYQSRSAQDVRLPTQPHPHHTIAAAPGYAGSKPTPHPSFGTFLKPSYHRQSASHTDVSKIAWTPPASPYGPYASYNQGNSPQGMQYSLHGSGPTTPTAPQHVAQEGKHGQDSSPLSPGLRLDGRTSPNLASQWRKRSPSPALHGGAPNNASHSAAKRPSSMQSPPVASANAPTAMPISMPVSMPTSMSMPMQIHRPNQMHFLPSQAPYHGGGNHMPIRRNSHLSARQPPHPIARSTSMEMGVRFSPSYAFMG